MRETRFKVGAYGVCRRQGCPVASQRGETSVTAVRREVREETRA